MKLFTKLSGGIALLAAFLLFSCDTEELELNVIQVDGITVTLVPEGGGDTKNFTVSVPYTDEDGKVYGELKEEDMVLEPNTIYSTTITYFSERTGTRVVQYEKIKSEEQLYTRRTAIYYKLRGEPEQYKR